MGQHSDYTRRWLDRRFARGAADAPYFAHMPIYGLGHPSSEPHHARRFARALQILRRLARLDFETLLDVGGAEGFLAARARDIFGCRAVSSDLSIEASRRAWELYELDALALSSHALPFPDDAFDVVLCSEVIEHVEFAVETLRELTRVARVAVILTTEEFRVDRAAIEAELARRCGYPHFERNFFHATDLQVMFGPEAELGSQFIAPPPDDTADAATVRAWIETATDFEGLAANAAGIVVLAPTSPDGLRGTPRLSDDELLDRLLAPSVPATPLAPRDRPDPLAGLCAAAVCPDCRGPLSPHQSEKGGAPGLNCSACATRFDVQGGIADLTARTDPTRARTATALQAGWPADRVRAALALRDALDLPNEPERRAWDFRDASARRGWRPNEFLRPRTAAAGQGWCFESTGPTPFFVSPGLGVRGGDLTALELDLRIHNPDFDVDAGVAQLFWLTDEDEDFAPDRHAVIPIKNDDTVHTYRLELSELPGWPIDNDVVCVRIDPANGPCTLELVAVRLE